MTVVVRHQPGAVHNLHNVHPSSRGMSACPRLATSSAASLIRSVCVRVELCAGSSRGYFHDFRRWNQIGLDRPCGGARMRMCEFRFDLSTGSVAADKSATALKTDPVCVSLANQITTIKGDGTIERLEKAAAGKSAKVQVKREALQKQAELNKANADFQTRCGPTIPETSTPRKQHRLHRQLRCRPRMQRPKPTEPVTVCRASAR